MDKMKLINRRAGVVSPMQKSALVAAVLLVSTMAAPAFSEGAFPSSMQDSDPRELRLAAFQKYLEGDLPGASDLYRRAIQAGETAYGKDSTFVADLCYEVGTIALEDGQFQNAENYLKKAVSKKTELGDGQSEVRRPADNARKHKRRLRADTRSAEDQSRLANRPTGNGQIHDEPGQPQNGRRRDCKRCSHLGVLQPEEHGS